MNEHTELRGTCHCGRVAWLYKGSLESATACNCTSCRRWGGIWAYGAEEDVISVSGPTTKYVRGRNLEYHFCTSCACVMYWRTINAGDSGKHAMAVNLRMTEPEPIAHLPIDHFDGLDKFDDLPRDGRCIRDLWF